MHKVIEGIKTSYHPHLSQVLALFQQRNCIIFAPALLNRTCLLHFGGFRLCYQTNVTISKGMKSNYRIFTRIALNSTKGLKFYKTSRAFHVLLKTNEVFNC